MTPSAIIANHADRILLTGATGFIGRRVLRRLVEMGFTDLVCFCRSTSDVSPIEAVRDQQSDDVSIRIIRGDLLRPRDCEAALQGVKLVYHLAAGTGTKSFAEAYANSVVTTRNLLEASRKQEHLLRFVNVGSLAVYSNLNKKRREVLDESSELEEQPQTRGDAYCYAKLKQDEIVQSYGTDHDIPYVILRPGVVYGPGKTRIPGRIGLDTFGLFLHLGGSNPVPLTYVENCADAIARAGVCPGVDGEVFNVVDDDLPTSRTLLREYKSQVRRFASIYLPHSISYLLFAAWGGYARWSQFQLPAVYNRQVWHAYWKGSRYSNARLKQLLQWEPVVSTDEALTRYFESCRAAHE